jgi:hypothetical protein
LPLWRVEPLEAAIRTPHSPPRGAKIIPFPGRPDRRRAVTTYPASLLLPARRKAGTVEPLGWRLPLLAVGIAVALAGAALILG